MLSDSPERAGTAPNLLSQLKPATLEAVLALAREERYNNGEMLFYQGDRHDGIFLIRTGQVKSYYVSEDGRELTLGFWTDGHYVGAPEMFGDSRHSWTALATAPTQGAWLPGRALRTLAARYPDLALGLIDALVHKTQCYCALLQLLATHSMRVRLARLLVMLAMRDEEATINGLSHSELASMIGSTRQWVSSSLARFEAEGLLIRHGGSRLKVSDIAALQSVR